MGLLGDILVGTLKIGGAIVCEVLGAAQALKDRQGR